MKLNIERPLWALAIIASLLLFAHQCSEKKIAKLEAEASRSRVSQVEEEKRSYIARLDSVVARSQRQRAKDSLDFKHSEQALNASADYWHAQALKRRPQVQAIADTSKIVAEFLQANDSLIEKKDSLISLQANQIMMLHKSYQFDIAKLGEKNVKQIEISEAWRQQAQSLDKKLTREQKMKRFWRGIGIGAGTAAVVLGLSLAN